MRVFLFLEIEMTPIDIARRDGKCVLTTREAAQALGMHPQTLWGWSSTGKGAIQPVRIGKRIAWPVEAVAGLVGADHQQ